jgi:hypothetical protein
MATFGVPTIVAPGRRSIPPTSISRRSRISVNLGRLVYLNRARRERLVKIEGMDGCPIRIKQTLGVRDLLF